VSGTVPLAAGFLLGLSTGPVCFTTCFPVVLPFAVGDSAGSTKAQRWLFLGRLVAGRFLAYTATGIIAGAASHHLRGTSNRIGIYAWLCLSIVMIAYGLGANITHAGFCRSLKSATSGPSFPLLLGVLMGFSICPPFLLALSYVLESSGSSLYGGLFFVAFFCATTVYIIPLGFLGHLRRNLWLERLGRLSAVLAGAFFLCYECIKTLLSLSLSSANKEWFWAQLLVWRRLSMTTWSPGGEV
jgi:hypothetical protein